MVKKKSKTIKLAQWGFCLFCKAHPLGMSAFVKDRRNHCDVNCFEAAAFCAHFEAKYDDVWMGGSSSGVISWC